MITIRALIITYMGEEAQERRLATPTCPKATIPYERLLLYMHPPPGMVTDRMNSSHNRLLYDDPLLGSPCCCVARAAAVVVYCDARTAAVVTVTHGEHAGRLCKQPRARAAVAAPCSRCGTAVQPRPSSASSAALLERELPSPSCDVDVRRCRRSDARRSFMACFLFSVCLAPFV